jgi:hypothetical protein
MFGFLKKLFGGKTEKEEVKPVERRKRQRRQVHNDRREDIRWEPDKEDRRSGEERRNLDKWNDRDR